jgi:hypothetical protein
MNKMKMELLERIYSIAACDDTMCMELDEDFFEHGDGMNFQYLKEKGYIWFHEDDFLPEEVRLTVAGIDLIESRIEE